MEWNVFKSLLRKQIKEEHPDLNVSPIKWAPNWPRLAETVGVNDRWTVGVNERPLPHADIYATCTYSSAHFQTLVFSHVSWLPNFRQISLNRAEGVWSCKSSLLWRRFPTLPCHLFRTAFLCIFFKNLFVVLDRLVEQSIIELICLIFNVFKTKSSSELHIQSHHTGSQASETVYYYKSCASHCSLTPTRKRVVTLTTSVNQISSIYRVAKRTSLVHYIWKRSDRQKPSGSKQMTIKWQQDLLWRITKSFGRANADLALFLEWKLSLINLNNNNMFMK